MMKSSVSPRKSIKSKRVLSARKGSDCQIDESKCFINQLFQKNLDHIMEAIFIQISFQDILNCQQVHSLWNEFIRRNIWNRFGKSSTHLLCTEI